MIFYKYRIGNRRVFCKWEGEHEMTGIGMRDSSTPHDECSHYVLQTCTIKDKFLTKNNAQKRLKTLLLFTAFVKHEQSAHWGVTESGLRDVCTPEAEATVGFSHLVQVATPHLTALRLAVLLLLQSTPTLIRQGLHRKEDTWSPLTISPSTACMDT